MYWVGPKVHLCFSIGCCGKTRTNFWANPVPCKSSLTAIPLSWKFRLKAILQIQARRVIYRKTENASAPGCHLACVCPGRMGVVVTMSLKVQTREAEDLGHPLIQAPKWRAPLCSGLLLDSSSQATFCCGWVSLTSLPPNIPYLLTTLRLGCPFDLPNVSHCLRPQD